MFRQNNLTLAVDFLISSIDKSSNGSAAAYSRVKYPLSGWSPPYPETTGYIIPTLFEAASILKNKESYNSAIRMAEWLLSIQYDDGAFPGGVYVSGKELDKSIFNTAQIIIGLISAYNKTNDTKYKTAYIKAAHWLVSVQEDDGVWVKHNYNGDFFPSYYTRVAWPILMVGTKCENQVLIDAAVKTLDLILARRQSNQFISDSGFKANSYAFLHTIAYTIRGFLEASLLIDSKDYYKVAYGLSKKLFRYFELKGSLGGAYYEDFKRVDWYRCLTGEAQMAIIWLKLFNKTNDIRYLNVSTKILDQTCATQPTQDSLLLKAGGLKGSQPYYGKYLMFRQPNWATKFLADAIMLEETCYKKINKLESHSNSRSY